MQSLNEMTEASSVRPSPPPDEVEKIAKRRSLKTSLRRGAFSAALLLLGGVIASFSVIASFVAFNTIGVTHTIKLRGVMQAVDQSTPIKHDSGGMVKNLFVTDGEVVTEGQVLLSLNTDDLAIVYDEARKNVAKNLLRLNCLTALKSRQAKMTIPVELKFALGRLNQTEELHRVQRKCDAQLETLKFQASQDQTALTLASDLLNVHERMAKTDFEMRLHISTLNNEENAQALRALTGMSTLKTNLRHSLEAAKANAALENLVREQKQDERNRIKLIEAELDGISDTLMKAENELSRIEAIREKRFVYASTSGRVQRLRVGGEGGRIAAGAYIMEIAPLTTDFEVLATVGAASASDVVVGQNVQVQLSGGMPKPMWVPARIEDINKVTANKRLVRIKLRREDLNKRDLLFVDHSLNGLGEQSEAVVSLSSESAMKSIKAIIFRHIKRDNETSL